MKSRESLIRLHRFKVDEIRRRLKLLDDIAMSRHVRKAPEETSKVS